jgi:uncharacterized protein YgiM (DUF1202 family)
MRRLFWLALPVALLLVALTGPLAAQEESTESTAEVATSRLNVRDTPNFLLGRVLTKIGRGETYPVVGRNLEGTWAQLDIDGTTGWVNARYVDAPGLDDAPFSASASAAGIVNARVQIGQLNVRDFPHHQFGLVLTTVFSNTIWSVTGRNEDASWAQLDVGGTTGWVNTRYLLAPALEEAAEVEMSAEELPVHARVSTGRLNVRHIPNFLGGEVVSKIRRGDVYPVLGRNFDASWAQLDIDGTTGWVNARYLNSPRLELAPLSLDAFAAEDVLFARVDTGRLNVRVKPVYPTGRIMTQLPRGHIVSVLGRDGDGGWLEVDYDYEGEGAIGWINSRYLYAPRMEIAPVTLYG